MCTYNNTTCFNLHVGLVDGFICTVDLAADSETDEAGNDTPSGCGNGVTPATMSLL